MTQILDVHGRTSQAVESRAAPSPAKSAAKTDRLGVFAITFGISFVLLYTVFERLNWPLFTYHPAVGKIDFWMQRPRSGEGPPMYWYGWLALTFLCATAVSVLATMMSRTSVLRATVFACVLAVVWPAIFAVWSHIDLRSSFDSDVVTWITWMSAIPGILGAAAVAYFIPIHWAERLWTKLLLLAPICGLVVLAISLKSYFLR